MVERTPIPMPEEVYKIDVPHFKQPRKNWCGITSLAMVLVWWGYEVTPEEIYKLVRPEMNGVKKEDAEEPEAGPTLSHLASVATELTPLKTTLFHEKKYQVLQVKRPDLRPYDVLNQYLKAQIPCIVRIPGHNMVTTGVNITRETYSFNNPANGYEETKDKNLFDNVWGHREPERKYPGNTSYLMLAIYPQRERKKRIPLTRTSLL